MCVQGAEGKGSSECRSARPCACVCACAAAGGKAPRLDDFEPGLPSLPVPPLAETLRRWLQSLEPVLDDAAMQRARASAAEFEASGEGAALQRLLQKRAAGSRNWLSEWWEEFAYLRGRLPLPTYANFFCTDSGSNLHGPSHEPDQVRRVALLVSAAMDFKYRVDSKTLMPLRIRGVLPVCMAGMRRIFGTTRVPGRDTDALTTHEVGAKGNAHVLVHVGASLFCLPVLVGGKRVPVDALERALRDALARAHAQPKTQVDAGVLMSACVSGCLCTRICVHVYLCACVCVHVYLYLCACVHTCVPYTVYVYACGTCACVHVCEYFAFHAVLHMPALAQRHCTITLILTASQCHHYTITLLLTCNHACHPPYLSHPPPPTYKPPHHHHPLSVGRGMRRTALRVNVNFARSVKVGRLLRRAPSLQVCFGAIVRLFVIVGLFAGLV